MPRDTAAPTKSTRGRSIPASGTRLPTSQEIVGTTSPGSYKIATCPGLTLEVSTSFVDSKPKRRWMMRFTSPASGKQREAGLGAFPTVGLADALTAYRENLVKIARGVCPLAEKEAIREGRREEQTARTTFWSVVEDYIAANSPKWAAPPPGRYMSREEAFWRKRFKGVVAPIANKPIGEITKRDVADVLRPIYDSVSVCDKIQKRMHAVFARAIAQDLYAYANPAVRNLVETQIRVRKPIERRVTHRAAVHWHNMPEFWKLLMEQPLTPKRLMLQLVVVTGFRGIEVRTLRWSDVMAITDPYAGEIAVAVARTGKSEDYRQPLSVLGLEVIEAARALGGKEFVFPSPDSASEREMPYTENALMLYVRANLKNFADKHGAFSVHGFRSTLETWASENGYRKDLVSALTGHFNKTEYNRSEFLKDKYEILKRYSRYLVQTPSQQPKIK